MHRQTPWCRTAWSVWDGPEVGGRSLESGAGKLASCSSCDISGVLLLKNICISNVTTVLFLTFLKIRVALQTAGLPRAPLGLVLCSMAGPTTETVFNIFRSMESGPAAPSSAATAQVKCQTTHKSTFSSRES